MLVMACMRVPSLFWGEYHRFFIEGLLALSRLWGLVVSILGGEPGACILPSGVYPAGALRWTLLEVSILGMAYDCHVGPLLLSWGVGVIDCSCWELWIFVGLGMGLSRLWGDGGLVGSFESRERSVHKHLAFLGLSGS